MMILQLSQFLSNTLVKLLNVCATIERKQVLTNVNLEIKRGENWAIVGPNGSGKTTLLKIINGYMRPSQGSVEILEQKHGEADLRELRKEIGFVSSYMNDLISLDDNVLDIVVAGRSASTRLWAIPPAEDVIRARKLLRFLDCARYEDSNLRGLSQGEKQKILIARALMTDPKLLALDEPCAGLDLKSRESFLSSISKIARKGTVSIIYVTHRIDEIPSVFTHALLLNRGKTVAQGKISSVLNSANLSKCFGVKITAKKFKGRYFATINQKW
jgi:iron complex transport system ATP-binding protein